MIAFSLVLFLVLFKDSEQQDLFLLLMVGMIVGTFFRSISTFLQVVMDPNEYDKLQGKLFASFQTIDFSFLFLVIPILFLAVGILWHKAPYLDVYHLGSPKAFSLGVPVKRFQLEVLILSVLLVACTTALVGPIAFLGFIVANISYSYLPTYSHRWLFIIGTMIGFLFLLFSDFLVVQFFNLNTTSSIIIEFVGGVYFIWKLLSSRRKSIC